MATEIGKAYVQIIPSAKGIKGSVSKILDPEAKSAGQSGGTGLGSSLVGTVKKVIVAAGIGKALMTSLNEGANLQQSLGGIETLFKDSADTVKKHAEEAYKTTGISANAYMENVTGFSASLLQSLGGDTAKAAKISNMAMIDMADNSNKMGSSMESIQVAYQGFAKQNYTMLDNLKLGYGGTKSEMERLLADATKLTGVKYDINNLSDVYEAIHAVQTELGITGTTALEAEETFTGSFNAMKAAVSNVLGALSLGEGLRPALEGLADTVITFFFDNLIPMIGTILMSLPEAIFVFAEAIIPRLIEVGKNILDGLGIGVGEGFTEMVSTISESINALVEFITPLMTNFISGLVSTVQQYLPQIKEIFNNTFELIKTIVEAVTDFIMNTWSQHGEAITNRIKAIWEGIKTIIDGSIKMIQGIIKTITALIKGDWQGAWEGIKQIASGAWEQIKGIVEAAINIVKGVIDGGMALIKGVMESVWNAIKGVTSAAWEDMKSKVSSIVDGIKSKVSSVFEGLKGTVTNIWNSIKTAITRPIEAARDAVKAAIDKIKSFFNFSWSLPPLKLPRISISGRFSLNPPSVPSFGISWYKEGGIFDTASIIGVGEAGEEAVLPTHKLDKFLNEAVRRVQGGDVGSTASLDYIANLLEKILSKNSNVYIDKYKLIGEILDEVDARLADKQDINDLAYGGI